MQCYTSCFADQVCIQLLSKDKMGDFLDEEVEKIHKEISIVNSFANDDDAVFKRHIEFILKPVPPLNLKQPPAGSPMDTNFGGNRVLPV